MKKFFRKALHALYRGLPFLILCAVVMATVFFPKGKPEETSVPRVVRVWHIDTFEGGKGSRASFLKDAARKVEKEDKSVYYLVSTYTAEGASAAAAEGNYPDLLSFGIGFSDFTERFLPLSYRFAGGETDGGFLAYPWCAGRYSLFSLDDNFEDGGAVAVSSHGSNLSELAAYLNGIEGERVESTAAYVDFLNKKYRYLLGTQRDECRFQTRGVSVYRKDLTEFCDLYQYIACLSAEKHADCLKFLRILLSEEVQNGLSSIGMFPLSETHASKTVSVFSSSEALLSLTEAARAKSDRKNIDKFLKSI